MKKQAFTLVELLVVMTLLALLAAMTAVMMSGARADALRTKTAREIDLIEQILLTRIAEMGFSPVPFVLPTASTAPIHSAARLRLLGRRDQLRMAFPDRRADLLHPPTRLQYGYDASNSMFSSNKIQPPPAWGRMRTRIGLGRPSALPAVGVAIDADDVYPGGAQEIWGRRNVSDSATHIVLAAEVAPPATGTDVSALWTVEHESAECLWLILSVTEFNGVPALDILGKSYVENTDGDLVPEMVDAWGKPLVFLRWPCGAQYQDIQNSGPDAFDYLRTDYRYADSATNTANDPINLIPMIVSSGLDREFGIRTTVGTSTANATDPMTIRQFSYATTLYTGTSSVTTPGAPYFYPDPYINVVNYDPVASSFDAQRNNIILSRARRGIGSPLPLNSSVDPDTGPVSEFVTDNITNFGS